MGLPLILGAGAAVYAGFKMIGKAFGNDPDFTQAWMMNRMSGRGGFMKTFFADGMGKLFMGSRTASAMFSGGMPFGGMMCGHPGMMSPYMMNPMAMGTMPYNPMMMGSMMWGC